MSMTRMLCLELTCVLSAPSVLVEVDDEDAVLLLTCVLSAPSVLVEVDDEDVVLCTNLCTLCPFCTG